MKDEIQRIKNDYENHIKDELSPSVQGTFEWLIEQSEKAEELKTKNAQLNQAIGKYAGKMLDIALKD